MPGKPIENDNQTDCLKKHYGWWGGMQLWQLGMYAIPKILIQNKIIDIKKESVSI